VLLNGFRVAAAPAAQRHQGADHSRGQSGGCCAASVTHDY
jgi:hypothetical protein